MPEQCPCPPDLGALSRPELDLWLSGYEVGIVDGTTRENRRLAEVYRVELRRLGLDFSLSDDELRRIYRILANSPDLAALEERRGRPERAAELRRRAAERERWRAA